MTGDGEAFEPHLLAEDDFRREVQSFQFWFDSVEGYLADRPHGHEPTLVDEPMADEDRRRLVTILCNYCVGEAAALEASSGLVRLAPNHHARIFMATQVVDQVLHLEGFLHRLGELGVDDPQAEVDVVNPGLQAFRRRLLKSTAATGRPPCSPRTWSLSRWRRPCSGSTSPSPTR